MMPRSQLGGASRVFSPDGVSHFERPYQHDGIKSKFRISIPYSAERSESRVSICAMGTGVVSHVHGFGHPTVPSSRPQEKMPYVL